MISKSSVKVSFHSTPDITGKSFGIGNFNHADINEFDGLVGVPEASSMVEYSLVAWKIVASGLV